MHSIFWFIFCHLALGDPQKPLSKGEALDLLAHQSFRWQQTLTLNLEADGKAQSARSAFLPHIQFIARQYLANVHPLQYGIQLGVNPGNNWIEVGSASVEFGMYLFDRSALDRIQAAELNQKIAGANRAQFQSDLKYLTLIQYLSVQKQQKRSEAAQQNFKRSEEIQKMAEAKVTSGAGLQVDLMRARGLVESDRFKQIEAEAQLKKAQLDLAITLGLDHWSFKLEPLSVNELLQVLPEKISPDVIRSRPDVLAAQETVFAAEKLKLASAHESLPKFSVFGNIGSFGTLPLGLNAVGITGLAGVQATFPLYTGGFRDGKTSEDEARWIRSDYQSRQVELEAKVQAELALEQLKASHTAIEASQRNLEAAQEELRLIQQRFRNGSASGLEISGAVQHLSGANDMGTEAVFAFEVAKLNYFKNIGKIETYAQGVQP